MQQLACLPPQSQSLLPKSYRVLVQEGSPVADFYPESFSIDMNNKRNPWEGVNLIPFIDAQRLMNAIRMLNVDAGLTEEEKKRNCVGHMKLFQYSSHNFGSYSFPFKSSLFRNIQRVHCSFQNTTIGKPSCPQETVLRLRPLADTMYIDFTNCDTSLDYLRIETTGRFSRYPTTVIKIPPRIREADLTLKVLKKLASNSLKRMVCYPSWCSHYAIIVGIITKKYSISFEPGKNTLQITSNSVALVESVQRIMTLMVHDALNGRPSVLGLGGIDLQEVNILLKLLPVTSLIRERMSGRLQYEYHNECILLPFQLVQPVSKITNPRFTLLNDQPIWNRIKKGDCVVFLGAGSMSSHSLQGAVGYIEAIKDELVTVKLTQLPLLTSRNALYSSRSRWYTSYELAEILQIPRHAVEMLVSRYRVQSSQNDHDIGMDWVHRDHVNPRGFADFR